MGHYIKTYGTLGRIVNVGHCHGALGKPMHGKVIIIKGSYAEAHVKLK